MLELYLFMGSTVYMHKNIMRFLVKRDVTIQFSERPHRVARVMSQAKIWTWVRLDIIKLVYAMLLAENK